MPKAFLFTHKRYDMYNLNVPRIRKEKDELENPPNVVVTPFQRMVALNSVKSDPIFVDDNITLPLKKSEWTLVIDQKRCVEDDDSQPVNLSVKKIDLFNLTQLAEVSLAAAKSEAELDAKGEHQDNTAVRHVCSECGKGFSTLSNLARHRQTHRSPNDSSAVKKCPHCDKVYVSMPAFSMHLRTHNQGCKCPYCGKGFSRPWLLQGHIRTHTGEKPFKCNICGKAFADKSNLRAHTQTHSTEKPFVCSRCGKNFALKSYLCKHIESSCMRTNRTVKNSNSTTSLDYSSPSIVSSTC